MEISTRTSNGACWILQDEYVNILNASLQVYMNVYVCICIVRLCMNLILSNLNFVYGVAWTTCAYTQRTPSMSPPYSLPTRFVFFCVSSLFCCSHCRPPVVDPNAFCFAKFIVPLFVIPLEAVHGILDVVPSPVVNSSSHLITCHFPSWTSRLLW